LCKSVKPEGNATAIPGGEIMELWRLGIGL